MDKQLKSAIVGCGGIAQVHAEALKNLNLSKLTAFADIKPERCLAMAQKYGGNPYKSLEEMLCKEEIDVLHICTPHYLHVPMAALALKKGLHVFMEKPPAISRKEFDFLKACDGIEHLGICFQNRYNQSVQYLKKLLSENTYGKALGARAFVTWFRDKAYYTESGWRGALATEGGGALINQSIHTLDLLVYLLGTPIQVEASVSNHHLKGVIEVEDTVEAYIDFGDQQAIFYATTAFSDNSPVMVEIVCEQATIRMEETEVTIFHKDEKKEQFSFQRTATVGKNYWGAGHEACIGDFYHCILSGEKFPIQLADIERTAKLMYGIYQSAAEHQTVTL